MPSIVVLAVLLAGFIFFLCWFLRDYGDLIKQGLRRVVDRYRIPGLSDSEPAAAYQLDEEPAIWQHRVRSRIWVPVVASVTAFLVGAVTVYSSHEFRDGVDFSLTQAEETKGEVRNIDLNEKTFTVDDKVFSFSPDITVGPTLQELKEGDKVVVTHKDKDAGTTIYPAAVVRVAD